METNVHECGEDILNENMVSIADNNFSIPGCAKIVFSCTLSIILATISVYIHLIKVVPLTVDPEYDISDLFKFKILWSISLYLSIYFFFEFVILLVTKGMFTKEYKLNLISLILYRKSTIIKICASLFIFSCLLHWYEYVWIPVKTNELLSNEPIDGTSQEKMSKSKYIVEHFSTIILSISVFFSIQMIKSIFMAVVEIKMYFSHYMNRIEQNEENTKVIEMLNNFTGTRMFNNLQTWGNFVFKTISPRSDTFNKKDCDKIFGTEKTKRIFKLFDTNNDNSITAMEFVSVYYGIIREKYFLNKALLQKNSLFDKLSMILSIICIPLGVFISISILGYAKYFSNLMSVISGVILSLSFIFSSVVGELFRSLIFIFLVRPYEAGDYLRIDGKIYIVNELGLLYSSFLVDSLITYVQNITLMSKNIINYRLSDVEEKRYKYKFKVNMFREKQSSLNKHIRDVLNMNTRIYMGKYDITNYKMLSEGFLEVEILIYFKINFQYIKGLTHNEDEFAFVLDDIFKIIGLQTY